MSTTSSVSSSTPTSVDPSSTFFNNTTDTTKTAKSSQDTDFMLMLLAQLKNQNPQEPMSNADMMTQMAQLTTVQELKKLTTELDKLSRSNSLGYAASLIGKTVTAQKDAESDVVEGTVDQIEISGTDVSIIIGDQTLPISSILTIS